jgi:DNA-binding IclR family transcriptional regulator
MVDTQTAASRPGGNEQKRLRAATRETAPAANRYDMNTILGKALILLDAFAPGDRVVALAELSRRTGLAKGTLHRVAGTLVESGLLERQASGYRLGMYLFELGMVASAQHGLREAALPFLQDLYESTHETVHLGVPDGTEVICVEKLCGHRQAPARSRVGGRMQMYCSAIGKAVLAFSPPSVFEQIVVAGLPRRTPRTIIAPGLLRCELARVVATGLAYDYEESAVGVACVAAPVLDAQRRVVAAISVTGALPRFRPHRTAQAVHGAARRLGGVLPASSSGSEEARDYVRSAAAAPDAGRRRGPYSLVAGMPR